MQQVQNKLTKSAEQLNEIEYEAGGEKIKLSLSIIKNSLVSGGGNVTDQEATMFLNLCRYQHLNPFLRDAYLVKHGNYDATIVTGKEVFTKRARRSKNYKGQQAGVIVINRKSELESRIGALVLENEELVGGWAKVFIDGYEVPIENSVSFEEYAPRESNGEINSHWQKKPATMIRKVALVQALREAFPEELQGMYSQEEFAEASALKLDTTPISQQEVESVPNQTQDIPEQTEDESQQYDPLA